MPSRKDVTVTSVALTTDDMAALVAAVLQTIDTSTAEVRRGAIGLELVLQADAAIKTYLKGLDATLPDTFSVQPLPPVPASTLLKAVNSGLQQVKA